MSAPFTTAPSLPEKFEPQPEAIAGSSDTRRVRRFGWLLIGVAAGLAYANSFRAPFSFDGVNYVFMDESIRDVTSWEALKKLLAGANARPLPVLSFAANHLISGYDTLSWHVVNFAIHIVAAWALYGVVRMALSSPKLGGRYEGVARTLALVVALIWVAHPLNTQAVTYLVQRHESLMGMFYLLTLYATGRYASGGSVWWGAGAVLACALGMMCKEVMVTTPLVAFWYDRVFFAASWRDLVRRRRTFYFALAATWGVLAGLMFRIRALYPDGGVFDINKVTPQEYALSQASVILHYLRLTFVPLGQNLDYGWQKVVAWPAGSWRPTSARWDVLIPSVVAIFAILIFGASQLRRRPALAFAIGSFFLILAPTSSVAPIVDLAFEHRMYLPLAAVIALVVVGGYELSRKLGASGRVAPRELATLRCGATSLIVGACIALTLQRNTVYATNLGLWKDVVAKSPHSARGHYNYAVYLQVDGMNYGNRALIEQAMAEYRKTLEILPHDRQSRLQLGVLYAVQERLPESKREIDTLLTANPDYIDGILGAAHIALATDDRPTAMQYVERALRIDPKHVGAMTLKELVANESSTVDTFLKDLKAAVPAMFRGPDPESAKTAATPPGP